VGKRQMLSIGGIQKNDWDVKDEFPQGMGILDMSALTWRTAYDSHAPAYASPGKIKASYAGW
jgi:hypothetical protein